ncbi:MAG: hypothetical protein P0S96_08220 [Simkaniaceae bacterium]|nr:hypothetical protein [Candidatus Sacchlamyda saccharinae]
MKLIFSLLFLTNCVFACDIPPSYPTTPSDKLQFGRLWTQIKRRTEKEDLADLIALRRTEINKQKEHWKDKIPSIEDPALTAHLCALLLTGTLEPSDHGCGGAYFLKSASGVPKYVLKPIDEDVLCLNNRKQFGSPFNTRAFRVRDHIPLYRTAQAEALSYAISLLLGFEELTPPTHLAIISHEAFFDIEDRPGTKEKLCSAQSFLTDVENLLPFIQNCLKENYSEETILHLVDSENFENLCLLIWILFDTDAHAGNLYVKQNEDTSFTLLKIDNGLTFPDKNAQLLNALYYFPHAKLPLSERLRSLIANLPADEICKLIQLYELDEAIDAFLERIEVIQKLAQNPNITFRDVDVRLHALSHPEGTKLALNPDLTSCDLKKLISFE